MDDLIKRKDAILMIQRHGVGCFDADEFYPEEAERFVIGMLENLPPAEPEPAHDIMDFVGYQVAWLESHNDLELEPELEKWIVRMLYDTAKSYIKEHPETERETGEWVGIREYCNYLRSLDGKMYVPSGTGIKLKYCNSCWESVERGTNYCPNCGAIMRGKKNDL